MIYFDNAATTFPKPASVTEAVSDCLRRYCGNPGRGTHPLSLACAERIYDCRVALSELLGVGAPERVIFTQNTTHALNLAIKGLFRQGDHVLISELEHNAVRRPLCTLRRERGITFEKFPVVGLTPAQILGEITRRLRPQTAGIVCTHASNICSISLPLAEIGRLCQEKKLLFVVDAAQSAGHLAIDMQKTQISALAAPAHKGLYGIQGAGILALAEGIAPTPLLEGGSGSDSLSEEMPALPPERYEAGTLPTPAIAGLCEGIKLIKSIGTEAINDYECDLYRYALERLLNISGVTVYTPEYVGAVLLFNKDGKSPEELASLLNANGICVRAGYHCAPLAHNTLGTADTGAVRMSFSIFNKKSDIDALLKVVNEIK